MATKVYNVKAPDGSIVKVRGPEGASPEEVISQAKRLFAQRAAPAPEPTPEPAAPSPEEAMAADQAARGTTLSTLLGDYAENLPKITPATLLAKGAEKLAPDMLSGLGQTVQDTQTGFGQGVGNVVEGIRQAANKFMGDDEELALLNRDTEMRKARLAELTKANPGFAGAGEIAGEAAPGMLTGGALGQAVGGLKWLANPLARVLAGTGAGAASGYSSALTPEQEQAGQRGSNVLSGAMFGGAAGALGPMLEHFPGNLKRTMQSVLPEDAVPDFLKKTTGLTDDTAKTYANILGKTDKARAGVKQEVDAAYDAVLKSPEAQFDIPLHALDRVNDVSRTPVTEEIFNASDAIKNVLDTSRLARTTEGVANELPFPVVSQAIKDLNEIATDPARKGSAAADTAEALARDLRTRVKLIGDIDPTSKPVIDAHEAAQELYRTKKVPIESAGPGAPVGSWVEGGKTQKDFEDTFLSDKSGMQLQDLFSRMPETEGDVRKLWATTKSGLPEFHRDLAPSTTRDVIFQKPAEREYASKLSKELRRREERGDDIFKKIGYRMSGQYGPLLNMLLSDKAARGIMPYGIDPKNFTDADKMAAALRASSLFNATSGDE